jgi:sugar phosphate isomerase/epimerase
MKIGYITQYSDEEVRLAAKAGFKCLSIGLEGDFLKIKEETVKEIRMVFEKNDIEISALSSGFCNHLSSNDEERKMNNLRFKTAMSFCHILGTNTISTNAWGDPNKSIEQNMPTYRRVFSDYAEEAEKLGIKIAIENCPHIHGYPIKIGNISLSPNVWDIMFKAVQSKAIGLEFDPSHLVWLGIDYIQAARKFADRIYHVHAKDTEIIKDRLNEVGIYGEQWWRYRIPGWGVIDWRKLISTLLDSNYQGNIVIEHEDPVFHGPRFKEGLTLGLRHLSQFIV